MKIYSQFNNLFPSQQKDETHILNTIFQTHKKKKIKKETSKIYLDDQYIQILQTFIK